MTVSVNYFSIVVYIGDCVNYFSFVVDIGGCLRLREMVNVR